MAWKAYWRYCLLSGVLVTPLPAVPANGGYRIAQAKNLAACDAAQQAIQLVQAFRQEQHMPGLQVAVSVKGQTRLSENMGYADVATKLLVLVCNRLS